MADDVRDKVILIVQDTLRAESGRDDLLVAPEDSMDTVPEWDSLNFMRVFLSINEAFEITPDFDDAIHYTSVAKLTDFLREQVT
ncbi:acyl carrier protein [Sulfitobacter sp. SK011]|jgi:acyl carrier protein|uniref:acyl carrier protein n=1 Tax=Sulfitobacter sp. SK011 TaxID=1389004 RepID=UPI000E10C703|nr:acyl carrier protein [Sulfitobacter sp. SK011]AXI43192.1 hypothetical protein C1J02_15530 [Sulfitobacter sp. SK011]